MSARERIKELREELSTKGWPSPLREALDGWQAALDERDEARDLVKRLMKGDTGTWLLADVMVEAESRLRAWEGK